MRPMGPVWHRFHSLFICNSKLCNRVILIDIVRDLDSSVRANPCQGVLARLTSYLLFPVGTLVVFKIHCVPFLVVPVI